MAPKTLTDMKKKVKKQIDKISLYGFYLILAGVVLSIIFNTGVIETAFPALKWSGVILLFAGMVMVMIPAIRDSKKRREEKKLNQNL